MAKHLNPLEKEFLVRQYKSNQRIKLGDFCEMHNISVAAFRKWLKQYEEGGIEGLSRADAAIGDVLPDNIDRTEESYKREILKLRIENERLKKNYIVQTNENGEQEYVRLKPKNTKS
jgi:transposase-like protein